MARLHRLSAPLCLVLALAILLCACVGPVEGRRKKPKEPAPAPADDKATLDKTEPGPAARPEPARPVAPSSRRKKPKEPAPAPAEDKAALDKTEPGPAARPEPARPVAPSSSSAPAAASKRRAGSETESSPTAAPVTACQPGQTKAECVRDMYGALSPRFDEYEACDNSTKQKLKQLEELRTIMETAEKEGSVGVPGAKAQIRNMIAQNTKLVAELGKYQGFSSENEKMQRTIRKTSTELDLLKSQVEVLTRKVKEEKRKLVEMEKEERIKAERCEEELGLLKDVYWSNKLKIPDAAK